MDLSIIIVNWNSAAYLEKCLASVYANTHGIEFEVIVVDNASFDGCGGMLARRFPGVKFIQSQENLGFAGANNLGFEHSTGGVLLFLNPDTEVVGDAIPTLFQALRSLPDAGAVGAKLLNSDGSVQTSCIQRFPTIWNQAIDTEYLRRALPGHPVWGTQALLTGQDTVAAVEMVSGASLMVRRGSFERVGMFSAGYFMYSEDVDLCYKCREAGLINYCNTGASVLHHGGGSTSGPGQTHFAAVGMRQSLCIFFRLRRGRMYALAYRLSVMLTSMLRCSVLVCALLLTHRGAAATRESLGRWLAILRWALGFEPATPDARRRNLPAAA